MNARRPLKKMLAMVPLVAAVGALAFPAGASAWARWTGVDPIVDLNGSERGGNLSVYIEWPSEFTCAVKDPIAVEIRLPKEYRGAELIAESNDTFRCSGKAKLITTETDVNITGRKGASISVDLDAATRQDFPVRARVSLDGTEIALIEGTHLDGANGAIPLS